MLTKSSENTFIYDDCCTCTIYPRNVFGYSGYPSKLCSISMTVICVGNCEVNGDSTAQPDTA